ncbi:RAS small monomeric GTPase, putative [Trichophyton verrucosum HKI 0517]|uniref:RAS small monomeric GTPase, putative n=1 Tax=Trichophyton verrucosum (strain HKI 0517) TaxID=663202 RepID=D4D7L3_TRIVH|nr:RAS small monomeric GTPase, putative [Trichophyton verrucosum HKI 0517]EFE42181.1 RAS small monomeric GTPase, putative [Trichophyton verrucosum HKI 0517]
MIHREDEDEDEDDEEGQSNRMRCYRRLLLGDSDGRRAAEEYRGLWAASNLNSDAFLLVYDITNEPTLETLGHFMEMIDMETENREEQNIRLLKQFYRDYPDQPPEDVPTLGMPPPVKIVAGNKCDLKEARVISSRRGLEWARSRGCGFMETKARKLHREQQIAQLHAFKEAEQLSSASRFFSAACRRATEPIALSQTAPLTTEERQDPTGRSVSSGARSRRRSIWLIVQQALTRRANAANSKRPRSGQPILNPNQWENQSQGQGHSQGQSRPGTLSTHSSKKPDPDMGEPGYPNNYPHSDHRHAGLGQFKPSERVSIPWWKTLCCCSGS